MADDAIDLGVDQLLSNDRALLGIGLIVFRQQFELDLGAADFEALGVEFFNGQNSAVLVVFAQVSLRASHRRGMSELDDDFRLLGRGGGGRRGGCRSRLRLFFLATGTHGEGSGDGEGNYGKLGLHRYVS